MKTKKNQCEDCEHGHVIIEESLSGLPLRVVYLCLHTHTPLNIPGEVQSGKETCRFRDMPPYMQGEDRGPKCT